MTAAAAVATDVLLACEMAVLRALAMSGKRARGATRALRGQLADIAPHELHTRIRLRDDDVATAEALAHLALVLPTQPRLYQAVDWYVRQLVAAQRSHTRTELRRVLEVVYER